MELRRILLRIMLICLALAAIGGVVGAIVSAGDTMWRVAGTAIITAVAVAIMIPLSYAIDKEKFRTAGLIGLAWTLVAFLLSLPVLWFDRISHAENVAITLLFWILCFAPAVLFSFGLHIPKVRFAARAGLVLSLAVFAILMFPVWVVDRGAWRFTDKFFEGASSLAACGFVILLNLVNAGQKDKHFFRWIGILVAAAAFCINVGGIVADLHAPLPVYYGSFAISLTLGAFLGITNNALLVPLVGSQVLIRIATLAAAGVCGAAADYLIIIDADVPDVERIAAAAGIVAACGILALTILAFLNRRSHAPLVGDLAPLIDITVICPRCSSKQKLKLNGAECDACHLKIDIRIEEPRCPTCNYLLYRLTSDRCPECGTPITSPPPALAH